MASDVEGTAKYPDMAVTRGIPASGAPVPHAKRTAHQRLLSPLGLPTGFGHLGAVPVVSLANRTAPLARQRDYCAVRPRDPRAAVYKRQPPRRQTVTATAGRARSPPPRRQVEPQSGLLSIFPSNHFPHFRSLT